MLNVFMLNVFMLNVFMLNVFMLNVFMLNVEAQLKEQWQAKFTATDACIASFINSPI